MGIGAGLYMYVVVVQKFTFAISSPDEFLYVPLDTKQVISETFFPANGSWHSTEETKSNTTKANNTRTKYSKPKQKTHKMLNLNTQN